MAPFITDEDRATLHEVLADTHAKAERELRGREKFEADLAKWWANPVPGRRVA